MLEQLDLRKVEEFGRFCMISEIEGASLPGLHRWVRSFLFKLGTASVTTSTGFLDTLDSVFQGSIGFRTDASELFLDSSLESATWSEIPLQQFVNTLAQQLATYEHQDSEAEYSQVIAASGDVYHYLFGRHRDDGMAFLTNDRWSPWLTGDFDSTVLAYQPETNEIWITVVREYDSPTDGMFSQRVFSTD